MDSTSEQIRPAEDDDRTKATVAEAAERLATAFIAVEEFKNFLPAEIYNGMADQMQALYDLAEWQSDPEVLRQILPAIIRAAIKKEKGEESA